MGYLLRYLMAIAAVKALQVEQKQGNQVNNLLESKVQGAILDLLKDVSQFNKKTIENLEHNNTSKANQTNSSASQKPEEAQHLQLSSKLGQKQSTQSKVESKATEQQKMQTNLKQQSAIKTQNQSTLKSKAHSKQEHKQLAKKPDELDDSMLPMESQDIQMEESSTKSTKKSKKKVVKQVKQPAKQKTQKQQKGKAKLVQKKAPPKKSPQKKLEKKKAKPATESSIVDSALDDAQKSNNMQKQLNSIASQQQDQLDHIDQVLGAAQLYESQKPGGKYAKGILKSSGKVGQPDQEELDMMDGDMLEEQQTMGDNLDELESKPKAPAPAKPPMKQQQAPKHLLQKHAQPAKPKPVQKSKSVAQAPHMTQSSKNSSPSVAKNTKNKPKRETIIDNGEDMDSSAEFNEEEAMDDENASDAFDDQSVQPMNSQPQKFQKSGVAQDQPLQRSSQIDEDDFEEDLPDDFEPQESPEKEQNKNMNLQKQNKALKSELNQCKIDVKKAALAPQEPQHRQGMAQRDQSQKDDMFGQIKPQMLEMSNGFVDQPWQQNAQMSSTPVIKPIAGPEATPSQKVQMIFESNAPAHQKILEFTKQYCLPELIDSKELKSLSLVQAAPSKDQQDTGARDLIPYVCFYNGLGMLAQKKKSPDVKIEAPKDLLLGFKKKRDFILSFKSGHHKTAEQCQNELKQIFNQQQQDSQPQAPLSGSSQPASQQASQLDTLMPFQEKYHDNAYLNIYQYFCKKQMKLAQQSQSESKSKVMKPQKLTESLLQMYTTGLELQQKLDKIMDYDQCNEDTALVMGLRDYCMSLFKDQQTFYFWGQLDLKDSCQNVQRAATSQQQSADKCAILNEAIFSRYKQTQTSVLSQVVSTSRDVINKKRNKELQLKHFVEDAADDDVQSNSQTQSQAEKTASSPESQLQQQNKTGSQGKDVAADPNSFEHSILSLVRKFGSTGSTSPQEQAQSQQQAPAQDSFIEKYQDLNVKSCQLFSDQFQDSNNQEVASACDFIQQPGQSLAQQKSQSVVTLQDHSQRIFNALQELSQNYMRCQSIPACSQRMDQGQLDNYNTIQQLSQEFLKDGFIRDHEAQIPQALFAMPASEQELKAPTEQQAMPSENRPNSTLEGAAPFIRSLQEEQNEKEKKKQAKKEESGKNQSSQVNQTEEEQPQSLGQQPEQIKMLMDQTQLTSNLSSLVQNQVSQMFKDYVQRSEKAESEQEQQYQQNEQQQMSQLTQMMSVLKKEQQSAKLKQEDQLQQQQQQIQAQAMAMQQQQLLWKQQQEQMAQDLQKQQQMLMEKQREMQEAETQKKNLEKAAAEEKARLQQVEAEEKMRQQQIEAEKVKLQQAQELAKQQAEQLAQRQAQQQALQEAQLQQKQQSIQHLSKAAVARPARHSLLANQTLEQTISQALFNDIASQKKEGEKQKEKKHHKHHKHHNATEGTEQPQKIAQAPAPPKPVAVSKLALPKLTLPKPQQQKKLVQISESNRKPQKSKQSEDDFENDLIQEEMAMTQQVEPVDESQLMVKNLEESSEELKKTVDFSKFRANNNDNMKAKTSPPVIVQFKHLKKEKPSANKPLSKPKDQKFGVYANIMNQKQPQQAKVQKILAKNDTKQSQEAAQVDASKLAAPISIPSNQKPQSVTHLMIDEGLAGLSSPEFQASAPPQYLQTPQTLTQQQQIPQQSFGAPIVNQQVTAQSSLQPFQQQQQQLFMIPQLAQTQQGTSQILPESAQDQGQQFIQTQLYPGQFVVAPSGLSSGSNDQFAQQMF